MQNDKIGPSSKTQASIPVQQPQESQPILRHGVTLGKDTHHNIDLASQNKDISSDIHIEEREKLTPTHFSDKDVRQAGELIDNFRYNLELQIIENHKDQFSQFWNQINQEFLNAQSYAAIEKKYAKQWNSKFKTKFNEIFSPKDQLTSKVSPKEINTAAFQLEISNKCDNAFYKEFQIIFKQEFRIALLNDDNLNNAAILLQEARDYQNFERKQKIQQVIEKKVFLKMSPELRQKCENVLNNANIHDYSEEELDVARQVVNKVIPLIKKHFNGNIDNQAWALIVHREPLLAKAILLLLQHKFDECKFEFRKQDLEKQIDAGNLNPEELKEKKKQLGLIEHLKDNFALFFRALAPWNDIKGPERLRNKQPQVQMQFLPFGVIGDLLEAITGGKEKALLGKTLPEFIEENIFKPIDQKAEQIVEEVKEATYDVVQDIKEGENIKTAIVNKFIDLSDEAVKVGKSKFIVKNLTNNQNPFSKAIKSFFQQIVDRPQNIKSNKWMPWLIRYGKTAGKGALIGGTIGFFRGLTDFKITYIFAPANYLYNLAAKTATAAALGAIAGLFVERYKGQLKAFTATSIPGAVAAIGSVIAISGLGALLSTGGFIIVGLAAVLSGIFGVYFFFGTNTGKRIVEKFQKIIWIHEVQWFEQWGEKLQIAETNRKVFEQTAEIAKKRQKDMNRRLSVASDPRYKSLVQICEDKELFSNNDLSPLPATARESFLEAIRLNPKALSDPQSFKDLIEKLPRADREKLEPVIDLIIQQYAKDNKNALKIGLEGRVEDISLALGNLHPKLPEILKDLDNKAIKNKESLKQFLLEYGVDQNTINQEFKRIYKEEKVEPSILNKIGNNILSLFRKAPEPIPTTPKEIEEANKRIIHAVIIMAKILEKKATLASPADLTKLLIEDIGLDLELVKDLFEKFDQLIASKDKNSVQRKIAKEKDDFQERLNQSEVQEFLIKEYIEEQTQGKLDINIHLLTPNQRKEILAIQNQKYLADYIIKPQIQKN